MNFIDLVIIRPARGDGRSVGYAPRGEVNVGDTVITQFGEEVVLDTLFTYSEDDVYQFLKRNSTLTRIQSVMKTIDYSKIDEADRSAVDSEL